MMYSLALGAEFSPISLTVAALGLMFVVIGNYLPKCRMNSTLGIKVSWAYTSEENWNATHRFGGRVWFIGGFVVALCGLLPGEWGIWVMFAAIFLLVLIPVVYSYRYYRRQKANGDALNPPPKMSSKTGKISLIAMFLVILFALAILFCGDVEVEFGTDSFTVNATFYDDMTVDYSMVDSIEYREGNVPGARVGGFGSLRLLLGWFENEEFGTYTRYTYYKPEACIVLTSGGNTLVISGKTAEETREIYNELNLRIQ